ncbi:MAG: ABC transporter permease [Bacteroidetes bacterium]|nr:MAG: ABC transporter permease [Bacteroidota bacterium]
MQNSWTDEISSEHSWLEVKTEEVWRYRDLVGLFVHRDFVATYKQTVLGVGWYLIEPLITTVLFTIIFNGIADIPTDKVPAPLFYMCGLLCWGYFSKCFKNSSTVFTNNANVFGKVYFPRLTVPISSIISALIALGFQALFFACFWIYYYLKGAVININSYVLLLPYLVFLTGILGLSMGLVISSLTTKYRDLAIFVSFGIQLLMYFCPIIYPISAVPEQYEGFMWLNPIACLIEGFRFCLLGSGIFDIFWLVYTSIFTFLMLIAGIVLFNKIERNFMDTV